MTICKHCIHTEKAKEKIMSFTPNKIAEIKIPSQVGLEILVSSAFISVLSTKTNNSSKIAGMRIAIHEAIINAIEHGNKQIEDKFVNCEIFEEIDSISIHIKDEGESIYIPDSKNLPTKEEMQKKIENSGRRNKQNRGMGRFLIHYFTDEVEYKKNIQNGTCIILKVFTKE